MKFSHDLIVNLGVAAAIFFVVGAIAELIAFTQFRSSVLAYFREWQKTRFGPDRSRFNSPFGFYAVRTANWLYLLGALLVFVIYLFN